MRNQVFPHPVLDFKKSSKSQAWPRNNCVEVALQPNGGAVVRDSKNPKGAMLSFTKDEWDAFVGGVKNDEFDN